MITSILPIKKKYTDISFIYITYLLALFPLMPYGARSIITAVWCLIGLDAHLRERKKNAMGVNQHKKLFLISILAFVYLPFTLFYSENIVEGFNKLVQMSSLLIYPVIFFLNSNRFDRKVRDNIIMVFCTSVMLLVIYQIVKSLCNLDFLLGNLSPLEIQRNNLDGYEVIDIEMTNRIKLRRFRSYATGLVNTHTTYQGLWIAFALFYLIRSVFFNFNKHKKIKNVTMLVLACILFFWLLLMSTRMPILAILSGGFITLFFFTKFKTKTYVIILGAAIFVAIGSYLGFTTVKLRVDEVFRTKFALPSSGNDIETYNSTNVRNGVYFCSLKIIKENALLGVGLGDAQDKLNDCYRDELGAKIYGWTTYNTHSQYLFFLLAAGLLGLLLFVISLYIQLKISVERKENQHFYFLIIVAIICLTENVLVRSDGLIFFSFFNYLFLFNPKKLVDDYN